MSKSNRVNYTYYGEVTKHVDGDTTDILVDLGFKVQTKQRFRWLGINAPETRGKERPEGLKTKMWVKEAIPVGSRVKVECHKTGKYGRWLGVIYKLNEDGTETNLNQALLDLGLARQYGR